MRTSPMCSFNDPSFFSIALCMMSESLMLFSLDFKIQTRSGDRNAASMHHWSTRRYIQVPIWLASTLTEDSVMTGTGRPLQRTQEKDRKESLIQTVFTRIQMYKLSLLELYFFLPLPPFFSFLPPPSASISFFLLTKFLISFCILRAALF